jgi:hypothetical protein
MNGSARGTALIIVLVAVPVLVGSLVLAWRGSARAVLAWLGAMGVLAHNALMFVFATPVQDCAWPEASESHELGLRSLDIATLGHTWHRVPLVFRKGVVKVFVQESGGKCQSLLS